MAKDLPKIPNATRLVGVTINAGAMPNTPPEVADAIMDLNADWIRPKQAVKRIVSERKAELKERRKRKTKKKKLKRKRRLFRR